MELAAHQSQPVPLCFRLPVHFFLLVLMLSLVACSSSPFEDDSNTVVYPQDIPLGLPNEMIKENLYIHYQEWQGVPYQVAGTSKQGSDCSWFVFETFREQFGIQLPRSTDYQVQQGSEVDKFELIAGDLVFFKTGFFQRHVGVYLENGTFMHVSTEKGVMISRLDDEYWGRKYWTARRIPI